MIDQSDLGLAQDAPAAAVAVPSEEPTSHLGAGTPDQPAPLAATPGESSELSLPPPVRRYWPEPPPPRMPAGEPSNAAVPDWAAVVPGSRDRPVKQGDGRWSAGGLIALNLCQSCRHYRPDGSCHGPMPQSLRVTATACGPYLPRLK